MNAAQARQKEQDKMKVTLRNSSIEDWRCFNRYLTTTGVTPVAERQERPRYNTMEWDSLDQKGHTVYELPDGAPTYIRNDWQP